MRRPPRSIHHIRTQLDILKVDRSTASIGPLVCYTSPSSESLEARLGAPLVDTYPSMSRGNLRQRARTRQTQIASSVSHPSISRVPRILSSSACVSSAARRQSNHHAVPLSTVGLNHVSLYTHTNVSTNAPRWPSARPHRTVHKEKPLLASFDPSSRHVVSLPDR